MDLVTHSNTIPWLVDPGFFITLIAYMLDATAVTIVVGVVYALLRGVLSHDDNGGLHRYSTEAVGKQTLKVPFTHGWNFPMTHNYRERSHHEA
jgi:hypothetical protein